MSKKYVMLCKDEIKVATEKAILVEDCWVPKSQLIFVVNNQYYDYETETVKDFKKKDIYCYLLPLWLHMKNHYSYKKSDVLDEYIKAWNTDMRTTIEYESYKFLSFEEYKKFNN